MIDIIICSGVVSMSEKLTILLESGPLQIKIWAHPSTVDELMSLLEERLPDIIILHVADEGDLQRESIRMIARRYFGLPVLVVGSGLGNDAVASIIRAGAMGYIDETQLNEELANAVDTLASREDSFITQSVAEMLTEEVQKINLNTRKGKLTDREFRIMRMIASGKKMKEIADELSVSLRTVYTYRTKLMDKMELNSNVAIKHFVLDQHLMNNE